MASYGSRAPSRIRSTQYILERDEGRPLDVKVPVASGGLNRDHLNDGAVRQMEFDARSVAGLNLNDP
jgi:hypothetical protein